MEIRICYYFFGWDIIITFLVIAVVQIGTCPVWVRSRLVFRLHQVYMENFIG